jgi:putative ABC transport system substrate-binding protein
VLDAFRKGLRELGYVEGENIVIEPRYAGGRAERLPALGAELVRLKVDVLLVAGGAALDGRKVTSTIPIVVVAHPDPVGVGLVASLAHPGGNVTGLASDFRKPDAKRRRLLKRSSIGVSCRFL